MPPHESIPPAFRELWDTQAPTPARQRLMDATRALSDARHAEDDARDRYKDLLAEHRSSHGCDPVAYFNRWCRINDAFHKVWRRSEALNRAQGDAALGVVQEIVANLPPGTCITDDILSNLHIQLHYDPRVDWPLFEAWREECNINDLNGAPPWAVLQ